MRTFFTSLLFFGFLFDLRGQTRLPLTEAIKQVSVQWRQDSTSCIGYRKTLYKTIVESQIDSVGKDLILSYLGKPSEIKKIFDGVAKKNYVGYTYIVYKDKCPKIIFEGYAIQFLFDESEKHLVDIAEINYCR